MPYEHEMNRRRGALPPARRCALLCWAAVLSGFVSQAAGADDAVKLLRVGGPASVRHLVPGRWSVVSLDVANRDDAPREATGLVHFPQDTYRQYGRRLWMPPQSVRHGWFALLVPDDLPKDRGFTEIKGVMRAHGDEGDTVSGAGTGERFQTNLLPVYHGKLLAGIFDESADGAARSAVVAMRDAQGLDHQVSGLDGQPLAPGIIALDGLDRLVIADDRLLSDAAARSSVKQWIIRGGVAWIMLDRVDAQMLDVVLGGGSRCHLVDRVDLMETRIVGRNLGGKRLEFAERELDEPVSMARVLVSDVDVSHSMDGWPVAFWQSMGRGRVLVTTLGARGWTRPRTPEDPVAERASLRLHWLATEPLERLSYEFYQPVPAVRMPEAAAAEYVQGRVGYQVASRGAIVGTIGLFVFLLVVGAAALAARGRLEHIGWLGPAGAILAAALLAGMGRMARSKVPPTSAVIEFVDVAKDEHEIYSEGRLALYLPEAQPIALAGKQSWLQFDALGTAGATRALVWRDLDRWELDGLRLSGGSHETMLATTRRADQPIGAVATFGPQGIVGHLDLAPFGNAGDAVIVVRRAASLSVAFDGENGFSAPVDAVLGEGEFLADSVLSDEQRRRQAVYRKLEFPTSDIHRAGDDEPALFVWADPPEIGLGLPEETRRIGAALLRIPLRLTTPAPGTRVAIASTFLPFESVAGPGRDGPAPSYGNQDGQWIFPLSEPLRTVLKFTLPRVLRGARVERAVATITIRAPDRQVTVEAISGEEFLPLVRRQSPLGSQVFEIDDVEHLQPDDAGAIHLAIDVGPFPGQDTGTIDAQGWGIEDVRLKLEASFEEAEEDSE